jgi:hypothetical protein
VQRELDPASETGTVDRGDGRVRQRADPAEELVAGAASLDRELPGRARKLGDVGPGCEDERLARDDERRPGALLQLGQEPLQRFERGAAEEGRLGVVLAVVDRDERDRVTFCLDARELELGVSQRGSPR